MNDTPKTDVMMKFCFETDQEYIRLVDVIKLERELNAANAKIKWLEKDLSDAYAEMRKQRPVITAVFDHSVWTKAMETKP